MSNAIPTFFYGSFINLDVLRRGGFEPRGYERAILHGYDIKISGLATLVRAENSSVYGILASATHSELDLLYGQDWLVRSYAPEPVVVHTIGGEQRIALCFIAEHPAPRPSFDYLDWILKPARAHGFPESYIKRLEEWDERIESI